MRAFLLLLLSPAAEAAAEEARTRALAAVPTRASASGFLPAPLLRVAYPSGMAGSAPTGTISAASGPPGTAEALNKRCHARRIGPAAAETRRGTAALCLRHSSSSRSRSAPFERA